MQTLTKPWMVDQVEQQLRDYLRRGGRNLEAIKRLVVALAADGESMLVNVVYEDGSTSETIFEGNVEMNDLDDIVAVMVEELDEKVQIVAERIEAMAPTSIPLAAITQFPKVIHSRGPAPKLPWEGTWMPDRPVPSLRARKRSTDCTGETVSGLAQQVADGSLDASLAGQRMRSLITRTKPARTWGERAERFHEAAIETDPNSFIHVSALKDSGVLSDSDYAAILKALG